MGKPKRYTDSGKLLYLHPSLEFHSKASTTEPLTPIDSPSLSFAVAFSGEKEKQESKSGTSYQVRVSRSVSLNFFYRLFGVAGAMLFSSNPSNFTFFDGIPLTNAWSEETSLHQTTQIIRPTIKFLCLRDITPSLQLNYPYPSEHRHY